MISDSSRNALPKGGALRDETKTAAWGRLIELG